MKGTVTLKKEQGIAEISFHHPKSNSLPKELLDELKDQINRLSEDPTTKVIHLTSQGEKAFCAGASFDELLTVGNESEGEIFFSGFANLINAMRRCPKFIVVSVQGKAVGGGVGLIAAADYAIATKEASIKLSELSIGIGPFVVAPAIERKTGTSALSTLTINSTQWKNAAWAYEKGLYNELTDNSSDLKEKSNILLKNLSSYNPEAMKKIKSILWSDSDNWDQLLRERAVISGDLVLSDFTKRKLNEFKKK